ncbi:hypothetical protein OAZ24_01410 [Synechococcus sp. AH-736-G21]|nr:hypothetical protein [Synechococcus sp. AH-736-G21]
MKTIKLFSPFRAGSNLVKAGIEHNCSKLQVLNTGDKHWKHSFFAASPNYDAYIFCVRHPLDLACAIRRYYFENGRNIMMDAEWESFFSKKISIFDQTSKTVRSPILYPTIFDLINAWYFNYNSILSKKKIKSSLVAYERLIANQKQEITSSLKNISMARYVDNRFKPITSKTKNMGDERYIQSPKRKKAFSEKITGIRLNCGFSSQEVNSQLTNEQKDFAERSIDWEIMKKIGYIPSGLNQ